MSNKILRLPEVMELTALSRSTIYAFIQQESFPDSVQLGERSVGWIESEINDWIQQRIEQRGA